MRELCTGFCLLWCVMQGGGLLGADGGASPAVIFVPMTLVGLLAALTVCGCTCGWLATMSFQWLVFQQQMSEAVLIFEFTGSPEPQVGLM